MTKVRCTRCGKSKSRGEFYSNLCKKNGLSSNCKDCVQTASIVWQKNNPARRRISKARSNAKTNPRRLSFMGKNVQLRENPRTGVCEGCKRTVASGAIKRTARHHYAYDRSNPERFTFELCPSCHRKVHALAKRRKISVMHATARLVLEMSVKRSDKPFFIPPGQKTSGTPA